MGATQQLGLIINPVAGMGGSVGLKGTDGELALKAKAMGATPVAESRAVVALSQLVSLCPDVEVLTCPGDMGAVATQRVGLATKIVCDTAVANTSAEDTKSAARAILAQHPTLLMFVGGDGTARDIHSVVDRDVPVLGVPSGVKMHSAMFAATARAAGEVAARYLRSAHPERLLADVEILDRVDASGAGHDMSPTLFGIVKAPRLGFLVPGAKASRPVAEPLALAAAVDRVAAMLSDGRVSLIGPGSTMQMLAARLGFEGTLLGVDAVRNGKRVASDLDERGILERITGKPTRIVVSIVGGQGFLFGRGNQQLSPRVISQVGPENIVIVSSLEKLAGLPGNCLLVDTGDEHVDELLAGYLPIIVSDARTVMMPVKNASSEAPGYLSLRRSRKNR